MWLLKTFAQYWMNKLVPLHIAGTYTVYALGHISLSFNSGVFNSV